MRTILFMAMILIGGCQIENPMEIQTDKNFVRDVPIYIQPWQPTEFIREGDAGMVDFAFVKDGDIYHIIGIDGSIMYWQQHHDDDNYGFVHATSTDLRTWTEHENIVQGLKHPEYAAQHIWAPCIIKVDETWHMFYTGVVWDEGIPSSNVQRILKSTSEDLFNWTDPILVFEADHELTSWGRGNPWDNDCRDPDVFRLGDGKYGMIMSVKYADRSSMVIGWAESTDLIHWELIRLLDQTGSGYPSSSWSESATYLKHNNNEYVFFTPNNGTCQIPNITNGKNYHRVGGKACEILKVDEIYYLFAYLSNDTSHGFDITIGTMFFEGEQPLFQE